MDIVVKMDRFQILQNVLNVKYTLGYSIRIKKDTTSTKKKSTIVFFSANCSKVASFMAILDTL